MIKGPNWREIQDKIKSRREQVKLPVLGILGLGFFLFLFVIFRPASTDDLQSNLSSRPFLPLYWDSMLSQSHDRPTEAAGPKRTVYPYSVIPGGALTAKELQTALRKDPVVASHYANFRAGSVHVIRLRSAKQVYVSYRIGNRVYWTHKKISLRAGETLLTDGSHLARTRCGNRISEIPVEPASVAEPPEKVMDKPLVPRDPQFTSDAGFPPPIWQDGPSPVLAGLIPPPGASGGTPPFLPPFPPTPCCGSHPGSTPPPPPPSVPQPPPPGPPPVSTPEPGTLVLFIAGATLLLILSKARRA
jgi:hypothetical protein